MNEEVLKIKNQNRGMIGTNDILEREWTIYSDLTVDFKETYNTFDEERKYKMLNFAIEQEIYEKIVNCLELSKQNNIKIDACDGDAWEFIQYKNGLEIYKKELGYIYGVSSLEEIVKILFSLVK